MTTNDPAQRHLAPRHPTPHTSPSDGTTNDATQRRARPFRSPPHTTPPDFDTAEGFEAWMNRAPDPTSARTEDDDTHAIDVAAWYIDELAHLARPHPDATRADAVQLSRTFLAAADALTPVTDASLSIIITTPTPLHDLLNTHSSGSDLYEFAFRDLLTVAQQLGLSVTVALHTPPGLRPSHVNETHHATLTPPNPTPDTRSSS